MPDDQVEGGAELLRLDSLVGKGPWVSHSTGKCEVLFEKMDIEVPPVQVRKVEPKPEKPKAEPEPELKCVAAEADKEVATAADKKEQDPEEKKEQVNVQAMVQAQEKKEQKAYVQAMVQAQEQEQAQASPQEPDIPVGVRPLEPLSAALAKMNPLDMCEDEEEDDDSEGEEHLNRNKLWHALRTFLSTHVNDLDPALSKKGHALLQKSVRRRHYLATRRPP